MKNMSTGKKVFMWVAPAVLIGTIIYFLNKKKGKAIDDTKVVADPNVPKSSSSTSSSDSFPLKQGSRGERVKILQRIIGADVDGIFGPNTENALISFAGVRVVNSQADLDNLQKTAEGLITAQRANMLVNKFDQGGVSLFATKNVMARQCVIDAFGAIQYTGYGINLHGGKLYSNQDYIIQGATKLGGVIFYVNKGDLLGTYVVDANSITVK